MMNKMFRNLLKSIVIGAVTLSMSLAMISGGSNIVYAQENSDDDIDVSEWMKYMPDDILVTRMNIPGAHDAGMYNPNCTIPAYARTQWLNLDEQLQAGIRFLDIRVASGATKTPENMIVNHNGREAYEEKSGSKAYLRLDSVRDTINDFLEKHDKETVILFLQTEWNEDKEKKEAKTIILDQMIPKLKPGRSGDKSKWSKFDFYTVGSKVPTLRAVRGRCVIICDEESPCARTKYEDHSSVSASDKIKFIDKFRKDAKEGPLSICQDDLFLKQEYENEKGSEGDPYVKFCYMSSNPIGKGNIFGSPYLVAVDVHEKFENAVWEHDKRYGWIPMDFVGASDDSKKIIKNIIKSNEGSMTYAADFVCADAYKFMKEQLVLEEIADGWESKIIDLSKYDVKKEVIRNTCRVTVEGLPLYSDTGSICKYGLRVATDSDYSLQKGGAMTADGYAVRNGKWCARYRRDDYVVNECKDIPIAMHWDFTDEGGFLPPRSADELFEICDKLTIVAKAEDGTTKTIEICEDNEEDDNKPYIGGVFKRIVPGDGTKPYYLCKIENVLDEGKYYDFEVTDITFKDLKAEKGFRIEKKNIETDADGYSIRAKVVSVNDKVKVPGTVAMVDGEDTYGLRLPAFEAMFPITVNKAIAGGGSDEEQLPWTDKKVFEKSIAFSSNAYKYTSDIKTYASYKFSYPDSLLGGRYEKLGVTGNAVQYALMAPTDLAVIWNIAAEETIPAEFASGLSVKITDGYSTKMLEAQPADDGDKEWISEPQMLQLFNNGTPDAIYDYEYKFDDVSINAIESRLDSSGLDYDIESYAMSDVDENGYPEMHFVICISSEKGRKKHISGNVNWICGDLEAPRSSDYIHLIEETGGDKLELRWPTNNYFYADSPKEYSYHIEADDVEGYAKEQIADNDYKYTKLVNVKLKSSNDALLKNALDSNDIQLTQNGDLSSLDDKRSDCEYIGLPIADSDNKLYKYNISYEQGSYEGWKIDVGSIERDKATGDITIKIAFYKDANDLEIPVKINLAGAAINDDFEFAIDGITDSGVLSGDGYRLRLNAANNEGNLTIPASEFTDSQKDYYFTVHQIAGSNENVDYDDREINIKANVIYDGDRKLIAFEFGKWENNQWKPLANIDKAEFINGVRTVAAELNLSGLKHLSKKPVGASYTIPATDFDYKLTLQTSEGGEIALAYANVRDNGDDTAKDIIFTTGEDSVKLYSAGEYKFKLYTLNASKKGWYYDAAQYTIKVKVTADEAIPNKLIVSDISYDKRLVDNGMIISQIYSEVSYQIPVKNTIEGIDSSSDSFVFSAQNLKTEGESRRIEITGSGEKKFDEVTYYEAGDYEYKVLCEEPASGNPDWKYDDEIKYYNVKVIRDETTGALKIDSDAMAKESVPVFTNTYMNQPAQVSVVWIDSKDDSGDKPNRPESIEFTLMADGEPVGDARTVVGDKSTSEWLYETEVLKAYKLVGGQKTEIEYTIDTSAMELAIGDSYDIDFVGSLQGGFAISCVEKGLFEDEDLAVKVVWDDDNNKFNTRPEYMLVNLETNFEYWDYESIYVYPIDEWKSVFKSIPKHFIDDAEKKQDLVYKVASEDIPGYEYEISLDKNTGECVIKYSLIKDRFWIEPVENEAYTGNAIKPDARVFYGITRLINGKDYTLKYLNNVNAGLATITVVGKGNYSSKDFVTFNINPKDISEDDVYVSLEDKKYTGKQLVSKPTIQYGKNKLKEGRDYTLTYSGDQTNEGVVTVTIKGIAQNGGSGNYTGERIASYKIYNNKNSFSKVFVEKIPNQIYTGEKIVLNKDDLKVYADKSKTKLLEENKDYIVEYVKNYNVGTATAVIKGVGDYAVYGGSKKVKFKIVARPLTDAKIVINDNSVYTGAKLKPEVEVYIDEQRISPKYYKVKYVNNKNAASASANKAPKVIVTGKGNYSKRVSEKFSIERKTISEDEVAVFIDDMVGGENIKVSDAKTTVKLGKAKLKKGRDYVVTDVNVNANSIIKTAKISFKRNYKGDVEAPVRVYSKADKIPLDSNFSVTVADVKYTGKALKPKITLVDNISGKKLSTKAYAISYQNNVNISDIAPVAIITGKGQYTGTISKNFRIYKDSITKAYFGKIPNQLYTGDQIKPLTSDIHVYADKDKTIPLVEGTDYTIEYGDNVNIGVGIVKIKGIGNYGGTKKIKFLIVPRGLFLVHQGRFLCHGECPSVMRSVPLARIIYKDYGYKWE